MVGDGTWLAALCAVVQIALALLASCERDIVLPPDPHEPRQTPHTRALIRQPQDIPERTLSPESHDRFQQPVAWLSESDQAFVIDQLRE